VRFLFLSAAVLTAAAGPVAAQRQWPCEPDAGFLAVQQKYRNPPKGTDDEKRAFRQALLDEALKAEPDNLFLHRQVHRFAQQSGKEAVDAAVEKYRKLAAGHEGDSLYLYLYGAILVDRDVENSVRLLNRAVAADPHNAWPHLILSEIYQYGRLVDKQKASDEVAAFWAACPASLDNGALSDALSRSSPQTAAKVAQGIRPRLEAVTDPVILERYSTLWSLELKATPPSKQADLRKTIAADVARLRALPAPNRVGWYQLLAAGAKDAGDLDAARSVDDDILQRFPKNAASLEILRKRFDDAHPYRGDAPEAEYQKLFGDQMAFAQEMLQRWPDNITLLIMRFSAALGWSQLSDEKLKEVLEGFLRHVAEKHDASGYSPFEYRVAETYLRRGIALDRVPDLVAKGMEAVDKRTQDEAQDDRSAAKDRDDWRRAADRFHIEGLRILVDLYTKTNEPAKASAALADARKHEPKEGFDAAFYRQAARVAELNGKKFDALVFLGAVLDSWKGPAKDKAQVSTDFERLWGELGGTAETRTLWMSRKSAVVEASESGSWGKPEAKLESFELEDTTGKLWNLRSLEGKTVAINLWATWCGFCVAEHPAFQKLYDKLKDRKDVVLLTFNLDESAGEIAPYMQKNGYTFPVIPAQALVNSVLPQVAIPRNWIFDSKGVFRLEQIGYNSQDAEWEKKFLDAIEKSKNGQ
jgi:thiol-disulfide isomerase/thioredoxin